MDYVANNSSELIVVSDLQVFELSQVWNGASSVSHSDPAQGRIPNETFDEMKELMVMMPHHMTL